MVISFSGRLTEFGNESTLFCGCSQLLWQFRATSGKFMCLYSVLSFKCVGEQALHPRSVKQVFRAVNQSIKGLWLSSASTLIIFL